MILESVLANTLDCSSSSTAVDTCSLRQPIFYHVKRANLNAHDHQIYYSGTHPVALEECLCKVIEVANQWYSKIGMIVNKSKHQALILGDREQTFPFPV